MSASETAWRELISATQASGRKAVLAITGGGSGAIGEVLRVPGGSRLLIEAQVPYDTQALAVFLGATPAQSCSADTAVAMAGRALARAARLVPADTDLVGLGATAALVADRPRQGEHRFHIACATASGVAHCTVVLAKGRRDRAGEEDLVARAIVLWLARFCGVAAPSPASLLDADERFTDSLIPADDPIDQLVAGQLDRLTAQPDGQLVRSAPPPAVLMPGSFNPVHAGHRLLAQVAAEITGKPVAYEISVTNVDKPPLTGRAIRQRLTQFAWDSTVELTRAPAFFEKVRLFPKSTFVIGADTAERLVAPKYYGDDEARMHAALDEIGQSGATFLVAVRVDSAGRLRSLDDVAMPGRHAGLFLPIPEQRFRLDTSSSALRARWQDSSA